MGARERRLRAGLIGMIFLLTVQFALGMAVNLFLTITPTSGWAPNIQGPSWLLVVHILLGLFLIVDAIVIFVLTPQAAGLAPRILAVVGAVALTGAALAGRAFVGDSRNLNSYLMAIGFAVAIAAYAQMLYMAPRPQTGS